MSRAPATSRRSLLCRLGVTMAMIAAPALAVVTASTASADAPVTHAISTTTNPTSDGGPDPTGQCKNGNELVNCNIYTAKQYVWLSGLPSQAGLDSGNYFFAVLSPGGQNNPNDGGANNLSDTTAAPWSGGETNSDGSTVPSGDAYIDRSFYIADDGTITNLGTHELTNNKIRLMPFDDTVNPGGVYILAVCSLSSYPVDPSRCKYDAFKVGESASAVPPTITKDAAGAYDQSYTWTITKDVDQTLVQSSASSATFNYTVKVEHDSGSISNVGVTGTITVTNFNTGSVHIDGVTDTLSDGTTCTVTNGGAQDLPNGDTDFAYSCSLSGLPSGSLDNTASVSWSNQAVDPDGFLAGDTADFTFSGVAFTGNPIDECVNVADSYAGTLGIVCVGDANPKAFTYSRTVPVPADQCVSYDNTATFTTNDTGATGSASQTVTVCGRDVGLTMGFWQNKNGQAIITGGSSTGSVCNSGTWLRQYAPFQDLIATATCAQVGTYVTNIVKAANASGASMNAMLKAQMLATSLDVYFSDPALGGNKINSPKPLGGVKIDLTKICSLISLSGTCVGSYTSTSGAFGGATALTVNQLLAYAASQSNVGGSSWYGQVKSTQQLAKNTFDAINNSLAFVAP